MTTWRTLGSFGRKTTRLCALVALAGVTACGSDPPSGTGGAGGGTGGRGGSAGRGGSGGNGGGGGSDGGASDAPGAGIQLKVTWWGSPDRDNRTKMVLDMYKAKNPNVSFTFEHYASTQGAVGMGYWPTMLKHAADGTLPDIMQHDYAYIEEWTAKSWIRPLDEFTTGPLDLKDVPQALIDGGKVGGKLMGVALGLNTQAVVVDADAFYEAGIPLPNDNWTWKNFEDIALELKRKLNVWGAGSGLHGYTPGWKAVYLSKDQWVFSADGKALGYSDDAPWIEHWKMLLRLQAAGAIPKRYEEPIGSNVEALHMVMRRSAMEHLHSNQLVAMWNAAGPMRNLKMYPLPRMSAADKSPIYMKPSQYFSIPTSSKNAAEAAKVIAFFTNDAEANKILGGERGVPINTKVLAVLKPTLSRQAAESFDLIERGGAYATKLPPNDPPPWTAILTQIFGPKVVEPVMGLAVTPEAAVALFRREANAVLAGGMVPDGGTPDVNYPADLGSGGDAPMWDATKPIPDGGAAVEAGGGGGEAGGGGDTGGGGGMGMSFFVTSTGSGAMGGNLGGLAGADAKCEMLAAAVGAGGKGWKAYLSTNMPAVNAKDRIGAGPWRNQRGQMVAANVTALLGGFAANLVVDEKGASVPGAQHDILTGTQRDGTAYAGYTCGDWMGTTGQSWVAHSDGPAIQRLSQHASGCTEAGIRQTAGAGRIYCFATMP